MLKLIGSLMILGTGLMLSCGPMLRQWERLSLLRGYLEALERMQGELRTHGTPLPKLMEQLAEKRDATGLFCYVWQAMTQQGAIAFYEAWEAYLLANSNLLKGEERQMLLGLGECLGRYLLEEQLDMLERTSAQLQWSRQETQKRLKEGVRLSVGVGLCTSAMLIVALL